MNCCDRPCIVVLDAGSHCQRCGLVIPKPGTPAALSDEALAVALVLARFKVQISKRLGPMEELAALEAETKRRSEVADLEAAWMAS